MVKCKNLFKKCNVTLIIKDSRHFGSRRYNILQIDICPKIKFANLMQNSKKLPGVGIHISSYKFLTIKINVGGGLIAKVEMSFKGNLVKLRHPCLKNDRKINVSIFVNTTLA